MNFTTTNKQKLIRRYTSTIQDFTDTVKIEVRQLNTKTVLAEVKALRKKPNKWEIVSVLSNNNEAKRYGVKLLTKYLKGE